MEDFVQKDLRDFSPDKSKFKSGFVFITKAMFYEHNDAEKEQAIYTLKSEDHKGYPSLKRLYLEMEDTTEYEFANKYLYNYEHWLLLCDCVWFKEKYLKAWRTELELKIKARAIAQIKSVADGIGRDSMNANKFILKELWSHDREQAKNDKQPVGRPTKKEIIDTANDRVDDDLKRLGLN